METITINKSDLEQVLKNIFENSIIPLVRMQQQQARQSEWMSRREVAEHLKVTKISVTQMVNDNKLRAYKSGTAANSPMRFKRDEVDAVFGKVRRVKK